MLTGDSSVSSGSGLLQLARMRIPFLFTGRPDAGMALLACLLACLLVGWAGLGWLAGWLAEAVFGLEGSERAGRPALIRPKRRRKGDADDAHFFSPRSYGT